MRTISEEERWLLTWATLIGAVIAVEMYALRTRKPHAPLSHHMRRLPGSHPVGQAVFFTVAWRFHRHLWPRRQREPA